jgi:hypothetical protein
MEETADLGNSEFRTKVLPQICGYLDINIDDIAQISPRDLVDKIRDNLRNKRVNGKAIPKKERLLDWILGHDIPNPFSLRQFVGTCRLLAEKTERKKGASQEVNVRSRLNFKVDVRDGDDLEKIHSQIETIGKAIAALVENVLDNSRKPTINIFVSLYIPSNSENISTINFMEEENLNTARIEELINSVKETVSSAIKAGQLGVIQIKYHS